MLGQWPILNLDSPSIAPSGQSTKQGGGWYGFSTKENQNSFNQDDNNRSAGSMVLKQKFREIALL